MGLKKRSKVSAAFSMSSLTDIIFLLLIFFMLTSSLVVPNALNLKLPSSSNIKVVSKSKITTVDISKDGTYRIDGRKTKDVDAVLKKLARSKGKDATIAIAPAKGTGVEHVVKIMDIALRYNINAILAPEK